MSTPTIRPAMKRATIFAIVALLAVAAQTCSAACPIVDHLACIGRIKHDIVDLTDEENIECHAYENYWVDFENCSFTFGCCEHYTSATSLIHEDMYSKCERLQEITDMCDNGDDKNAAFGFAPSLALSAAAASVVTAVFSLRGGGGGS